MSPSLSLTTLLVVTLTQRQYNAVLSWASDVMAGDVEGPEASVAESKLLSYINSKQFQLAAAEFSRWCLVEGRVDYHALRKRREEQRRFFGD